MKGIYILFVFFLSSLELITAQQDMQYTQYMYNTQVVNPAYAGSRGAFSVSALYRSQWLGLDGAPTAQTINLNSPVSKKVGLGLSVVNNDIGNGTYQNTNFDGTFSYSIPVSRTSKLSFGLKAGGHLLNVNLNRLQSFNPTPNQLIGGNIDKKFSPNFGVGIYYHTRHFYTGISVPNLLETEHFDNTGTKSLVKEQMSVYVMSGFVFDINHSFKFKPAALLKATSGAPMQLDLSTTLLWFDQFSIGAAYRWDSAISTLVGFQFTDKWMIGLAYDKDANGLGDVQFNNGSFEVFMRYELISQKSQMQSPRFF